MTDLWNSNELNLEYALAPDNYQTTTSQCSAHILFKIISSSADNYAILVNDSLTVEFYSSPISYSTASAPSASTASMSSASSASTMSDAAPVATATIVFPPTDKPLNLQQWIALVESCFQETMVAFPQEEVVQAFEKDCAQRTSDS